MEHESKHKITTITTTFARLVTFARQQREYYTDLHIGNNDLENIAGDPKVKTTMFDGDDNYLTTITEMPADITGKQVMATHKILVDLVDNRIGCPPYIVFTVERFDVDGFQITTDEGEQVERLTFS